MEPTKTQNQDRFDWIVIGSGFGSLSFASLLAKDGKKVLVLEKARELGGCASSYTYEGFRFEAGATTLVGWEEGLPLYSLFTQMGYQVRFPESIQPDSRIDIFPTRNPSPETKPLPIPPKIYLLNPTMQIHLDNLILTRTTNTQEWIEECSRKFGSPWKEKVFWKFAFWVSRKGWELSSRMKHFPPSSLKDLVKCLLSIRFSDLVLFLLSFIPFSWILNLPIFPNNSLFKKCIDEQLMITLQTKHKNAPFSMGCLGITYAHLYNTYVEGGFGELAQFLAEYIRYYGGKVIPQEEVSSIQWEILPDSSNQTVGFIVQTRKGNQYKANHVVSGIPVWNLDKMVSKSPESPMVGIPSSALKKVQKNWKVFQKEISRRSHKFSQGIWGAFQLAIVMPEFREDPYLLHYQIHLKEKLPHGGGDSFFLSFRHPLDPIQNPNPSSSPYVSMSISTHLENPESWDRKSPDYKSKKEDLQNAILGTLETIFPRFLRKKILHIHAATPATWETWTGRYKGRVGGIPAHYFRNPFQFPSSITPFPQFYCLGDTVYPGQGVPAVVLGGINLYHRIHSS